MGHKLTTFFCFLISFFVTLTPTSVSARTKRLDAATEAKLRYAYWWRIDGDNCDSGYTSIDAEAYLEDKGENEKTIFSYLVQNGYSNTAAAAIMGNLRAESGAFNPRQLQKGYASNDIYPGSLAPVNFRAFENGKKTFQGGFGIAQWTYFTRVENLQKFADELNLPVTSLSVQVRFLVKELNNYNITPSVLNNMTLREATKHVLVKYEAPLNQSEEVVDLRTKYAGEYVSYEAGDVNFEDSDIPGDICIPDEDTDKIYQEEYEQIDIDEILKLLQDGGMSEAEAWKVIEQYKRVTPDQYAYYNIKASVHKEGNTALQNCVAFTRWFVKEFYNYDLTYGNGADVVGNITNDPHSVPKAGAVFSWSNSGAGHTGAVLGIEGNYLIIGEASYHEGWIHVKKVHVSQTKGWRYAYPEDMGYHEKN